MITRGLPENDLRSLGKGRGGSAPAVAPVASSSAGHPATGLEVAGHITSAALHSWVLDNVRPLAEAALDRQGAAIGSEIADTRAEFLIATGIHQGVIQVETKLLELLSQLYAAEREVAPG